MVNISSRDDIFFPIEKVAENFLEKLSSTSIINICPQLNFKFT